eukprot:scaffold339_cov402-Prasinococcus_capsulatus_cf.AAC.15
MVLLSFCAFEAGLGLYWPLIATLRAHYIPDHLRSTTNSLFRVPLNLMVVVILLFAGSLSEVGVFGMCAALLMICFACILGMPSMKSVNSRNGTSSLDG